MSLKKTAITLTVIGGLPFIISALICVFARVAHPEYSEKALHFLIAYSSIILAFLVGAHWELGLSRDGALANYCLVSSYVILLLACLVLVLYTFKWVLLVSVILFLWLLITDGILFYKKYYSVRFLSLRLVLLLVAIPALLPVAIELL